MSSENYVFVDESMARHALALAEPTIVTLIATVAKRPDLHLAIGLRGENRRGLILVEHSFGDQATWEHPYDLIVRGKFTLSARTGLPSRLVQADHPFALRPGDTVHGGSVVEDEVVIAASGVEGYFDETICDVVRAVLKGLCHHKAARQRALDVNFFTEG